MAKRAIILLLVILFFAFLEVNFPKYLRLFGTAPDLLLICVVFFNIYFKPRNAFSFSSFSGIIKDALSLVRFGTNFISFTICGFVIGKTKASVYHNDKFSQILIVFVVSFLNSFIFYLLNLSSGSFPFFKSLFFIMLPEALYTAVLSPIMFYILKRCALKYSV